MTTSSKRVIRGQKVSPSDSRKSSFSHSDIMTLIALSWAEFFGPLLAHLARTRPSHIDVSADEVSNGEWRRRFPLAMERTSVTNPRNRRRRRRPLTRRPVDVRPAPRSSGSVLVWFFVLPFQLMTSKHFRGHWGHSHWPPIYHGDFDWIFSLATQSFRQPNQGKGKTFTFLPRPRGFQPRAFFL